MSAPVRGSADPRASLAWVAEVLDWTPAEGSAPPGTRIDPLWVLPRGSRPRTLVPSSRHGGRALWTFNDSMSQPARLRKAGLGAALDLGLGRALRLDRVRMFDAGDEGPSIQEHLASIVGHTVSVGAYLGNDLRPNRKPVLQVLDPHGRIVAFAKVGWNGHTAALVDNEAEALKRVRGYRPSSFRVPAVLGHGRWRGRTVLVVEADRLPLRRHGRRNAAPDVAAEVEVARSGPPTESALADSAYRHALSRRLAAAGMEADVRRRLETILESFATAAGDRPIPFGSWHGDWTPWNMARSRAGLLVFDWERYGDGVPLGYDRLHLRFQLRHQVRGGSVAEAIHEATRALISVAPRFSLPPALAPWCARLYLVEMALRSAEGQAAGMRINDAFVPSVLAHLEQVVP